MELLFFAVDFSIDLLRVLGLINLCYFILVFTYFIENKIGNWKIVRSRQMWCVSNIEFGGNDTYESHFIEFPDFSY